jgi:hypothetical protein
MTEADNECSAEPGDARGRDTAGVPRCVLRQSPCDLPTDSTRAAASVERSYTGTADCFTGHRRTDAPVRD